MRIVLTIPSLSKKGGGPATVVQHLSEHLAALGASISVLTLEAEPGQPETLPRDSRVNVVRVPSRGQNSWRSAFNGRLKRTLEESLGSRKDNVVHDFGLWLPAHHVIASVTNNLGIPRVCSPCGMLALWALRHKAWKKKLAWWLYQRCDLSSATLIVATAAQEVQDIQRLVSGKNIAMIPNGVEMPASSVQLRRGTSSQSRKAVFLGRIHPVKGLINLVEAWSRVRPAGWQCILAGPDEAGHRKELEALLRLHHLENTFEFTGLMEDGQKWALLKEADFFVLPSFTENFGISVAEALACAVPVITTKGTPWKDLVDCRCGWWADTGVETLAIALQEATSLSDVQRREMGQRGRRLVEEKYSWPRIAREMLEVYQWLAGNGAIPKAVKTLA